MNSLQVNQWKESFNLMTMPEKRNLIAQLNQKFKETKNVEYLNFLNKCIKEYNETIVKERKTQRILSIFIILLSIMVVLIFAFLIYLFLQYKISFTLLKQAFETGISTQIAAGTIFSKNDVEMEARDITMKHKSKESSTILEIWDFAYEDGDAIQIFIHNKPITEQIELLNEPMQVEVPTVGIVEIKGVHDGGGGITYAVYCELDKTTYLNTAPTDGSNQYIFEKG